MISAFGVEHVAKSYTKIAPKLLRAQATHPGGIKHGYALYRGVAGKWGKIIARDTAKSGGMDKEALRRKGMAQGAKGYTRDYLGWHGEYQKPGGFKRMGERAARDIANRKAIVTIPKPKPSPQSAPKRSKIKSLVLGGTAAGVGTAGAGGYALHRRKKGS